MRNTRIGEEGYRLYKDVEESVRERMKEVGNLKKVIALSNSAASTAFHRRTYFAWAGSNIFYICLLVMLYRYCLGTPFQREIDIIGGGRQFTGSVLGEMRLGNGNLTKSLKGKVIGDIVFSRSVLKSSGKEANARGNFTGEVSWMVDGDIRGNISGYVDGLVKFPYDLMGQKKSDENFIGSSENFHGKLVVNDSVGVVISEGGLILGDLRGHITGYASGEIHDPETLAAWFIEVGRSTLIISVINMLLCTAIAYDWATSMSKAYNYLSTIAFGILIAIVYAFLFAFALLDTLDINSHYPVRIVNMLYWFLLSDLCFTRIIIRREFTEHIIISYLLIYTLSYHPLRWLSCSVVLPV